MISFSQPECKDSSPPRLAGMEAETERRGTVGVTLPSSAAVDYFVLPASMLLTNS